jgi:two-component system heavy metal sensor histidine kinase CusS
MSALARNIDEMIDRLALLLGNQQQFIAHAAHELRSPLTTLYGELSNALRRPREADDYKRAIEYALRSTRRLKDLAEDLLALARLAGEVPGARERIALRQVIGDAIEQVRPELTARRLTVKTEGGDGVWIDGRGGDLTRMFRNLLENAALHSPEAGTVAIAIAIDQDDGVVTVRISDEGPGVAPQDVEAIFRPFIRGSGESRRRAGGSGLGLTIARDIARLHDGDVSIVASEERGASFEVRISRASAALAEHRP